MDIDADAKEYNFNNIDGGIVKEVVTRSFALLIPIVHAEIGKIKAIA